MEKITVFKLSPTIRDGGSIKEIITNIGIFGLRKTLRDSNDYFYNDNGAVKDENLKRGLREAINEYNNITFAKYMENEVENFNRLYKRFGFEAGKIKNNP